MSCGVRLKTKYTGPVSPRIRDLAYRQGYNIKGIIAMGTFSSAHLAYNKQRKPVVLRIIQSEDAQEFADEYLTPYLKLIKRLRHPNIVYVQNTFELARLVIIVLRYCENGTLLDYVLRVGGLNEGHAKPWFHQIAAAVHWLHVQHIAHNHICLANIFITANMNVKLSGFSLSTYTVDHDTGKEKKRTQLSGSLWYSAPELVAGVEHDAKATDVWALGVVLFAMVNMRMPFQSTAIACLLVEQTHFMANWDPQVNVTKKLRKLIFYSLHPIVKNRYRIEDVLCCEWLCEIELSPAEREALSRAYVSRLRHYPHSANEEES